MSGVLLDVHRVGMTFRGRTVLHDVTLQVREGEVYGILGFEESGKTTLLRILGMSLVQTTGRVRVGPHDTVKDAEAAQAMVGLVFGGEEPVEPDWTAKEYLSYFHSLHTEDDDRKPVLDALARLGIDPEKERVKDDELRALPPGLRRRVDLERALLHDPRLLLLDEPTVRLDFDSRDRLWSRFKEWIGEPGASRRAAVLAGDEPHELTALCDRIGVLRRGYLVRELAPMRGKHDCRKELEELLTEVRRY